MSNKSVGQRGETIAAEYLLKQGYKILETNKRFSRFCEIDIIALEKNTLVFIEVKTRRTNYCGEPIEAITMSKFQNIKKGLALFLQDNPQYKKYRIDAISIILEPKPDLKHFKNIYL